MPGITSQTGCGFDRGSKRPAPREDGRGNFASIGGGVRGVCRTRDWIPAGGDGDYQHLPEGEKDLRSAGLTPLVIDRSGMDGKALAEVRSGS